jgi:hypothetical protein
MTNKDIAGEMIKAIEKTSNKVIQNNYRSTVIA